MRTEESVLFVFHFLLICLKGLWLVGKWKGREDPTPTKVLLHDSSNLGTNDEGGEDN
jgi:hypothetical protein